MYGDVVLGLKPEDDHGDERNPFERRSTARRHERGVTPRQRPHRGRPAELVNEFKGRAAAHRPPRSPTTAHAQLWGAIGAVFGSWENDRARRVPRDARHPGDDWGTAVNVRRWCSATSATTRAPASRSRATRRPARKFYGEFLMNAQGEDVVAGIRTPALDRRAREGACAARVDAQLQRMAGNGSSALPRPAGHRVHDPERPLFMLQTRTGKRTGLAAVRSRSTWWKRACSRREEAVLRVDPAKLDELCTDHRAQASRSRREGRLLKGLPASPGAAIGRIVFRADDARVAKRGEAVLLVRTETSPEDIHGMQAAVGILTARGGMTSHAALVARGMGKVCVAACSGAARSRHGQRGQVRGRTFGDKLEAGEVLTLDGSTGEVFAGARPRSSRRELGPEIEADGLGRRGRRLRSPHQRRHPDRRPHRARVRRRGHRPVPHRAHVLRARAARPRCAR
jgi:pyruvate,orthophosphate dikinase